MDTLEFSHSTINQLADLLNLAHMNDRNRDDSEPCVKTKTLLTPGDIGPPKEQLKQPEEKVDNSKSTKDIWDTEEVQEEEESDTHCLGLKPEYDMFFKQHVTSEEIFLQMGNKGPGSASCEYLVVKIKLPNTLGKEDIILDVSEEELQCKTKVYNLKLNLPYKCNPRQSKAEWDEVHCELSITLLMTRELDPFNF